MTTPACATTVPTPRQRQVLDYIARFASEHGYAPTLAEVAGGIGTRVSVVEKFLGHLQAKGHLERTSGVARSIVLAAPLPRAAPRVRKQPLTPRQREYLDAIEAYSAAHGYAPTQEELCLALGVTPKSAWLVLRVLAGKGWIAVGRKKARSIVVLP